MDRVVLILFTVVVSVLLRDPPVPETAEGVSARPNLQSGNVFFVKPLFLFTTAAYSICGFTDLLITTHLAPFAADLNLPPTVGANAISLLAGANLAGVLISGWIANRRGPQATLIGAYLVRTAAYAFCLFHRDPGISICLRGCLAPAFSQRPC